jgi:hypothetical protein
MGGPEVGSRMEFAIACLYLVAMGSFGSHVVAIAQEVTALAENCNTTPTAIGIYFIRNKYSPFFIILCRHSLHC